jgi:hypothetical protein
MSPPLSFHVSPRTNRPTGYSPSFLPTRGFISNFPLRNVVEFPSNGFKIVTGRDCDCAGARAEGTSAAEGQRPESPPETSFGCSMKLGLLAYSFMLYILLPFVINNRWTAIADDVVLQAVYEHPYW